MATLKDVAQDAGVSIATVSCCLSGAKPVKPETRQRVFESIERLKYIPNASARSLKAGPQKKIGVILTDIDNLYHAEIFKGISGYLQSHGYAISVAFSNNQPDIECEKINEFISQNVAGLLLITCQPDNTDFFTHRITAYQIPTVFIEHRPTNIPTLFTGFDNYQTTTFLMENLLTHGYRRIALITGNQQFSSEQDCIRAYQDMLKTYNIPLDNNFLDTTNMSKEDAFKTALTSLPMQEVQAVITTAETIAQGVLEALSTHGLSVPEDILLLTFSQENWNHAAQTPGVIHTGRTAYSLGRASAKRLLAEIIQPATNDDTLLFSDRILQTPLKLAKPRHSRNVPTRHIPREKEILRLLVTDLQTSHSAELLANLFTRDTGIYLDFTFASHKDILNRIIHDVNSGGNSFDIYMYDVPWLAYMMQNGLVAEITPYIESDRFNKDAFFKENLDNCRYEDRYYGVPMVGGAQIMFYRRDLFKRSDLIKQYNQNSRISLRPPRTWGEFNTIARFFTRSQNPLSPTPYGTSFAGIVDEEMAPEILIRFWSFGGIIWDEYNRVCLDSPQNIDAFRCILNTLDYIEAPPEEVSIARTINDFCEGKTAMLITYTEYASMISNAIQKDILGQVGYAPLPGRTPVSIGWNLGLNPLTEKSDLAYQYFSWLGQHDTSYYMTILDGQSPVIAPYHSHELTKLYPWMEFTEKSFPYCHKRNGPYRRNALIIPQNKIEAILCSILREVLKHEMILTEALKWGHLEMTALFKHYGYPKPLHFLPS